MGLGPWFRLGRSGLCRIRGVTVCVGIAGTDIGLTNNIKAVKRRSRATPILTGSPGLVYASDGRGAEAAAKLAPRTAIFTKRLRLVAIRVFSFPGSSP